MPIADFKYRKEIEELINGGVQLPPLYPIDHKLAYNRASKMKEKPLKDLTLLKAQCAILLWQ